MKQAKWVRKRHIFYTHILKFFLYPYLRIAYKLKRVKYHLNKDENVLVLSNHQTDLDPIIISMIFNKPIYYVATDTLFSNPFVATLVNHLVAPIPKKKGISDIECIKTLLKVKKEGGSIGLFPEGNRNYAEFLFNIDLSTVKLIKKLGLPILFVNLEGGNGMSPRFKHKNRKGYIKAYVKTRLNKDEFDKLSDEELLSIIKTNLTSFDSSLNRPFKSNKRAEYLEKMLFVCPKCLKMNTLYSKNEYITCTSCNMKTEFTEDLHLKSDDINFTILNDWYQFQKKYVKDLELKEDLIFSDEDISLYDSVTNKPRKLLYKGSIKLTKDKVIFGDYLTLDVKDIYMSSVLSGSKFSITINDKLYMVCGKYRFNPLKYVLMFNKLDTIMKTIDHYYCLSD